MKEQQLATAKMIRSTSTLHSTHPTIVTTITEVAMSLTQTASSTCVMAYHTRANPHAAIPAKDHAKKHRRCIATVDVRLGRAFSR